MLRIGKVSEVNSAEKKVRVHFPDSDIVSDWLKVVTATRLNSPYDVDYQPKVNDTVLCVYNDGFNSDGYVLGALV